MKKRFWTLRGSQICEICEIILIKNVYPHYKIFHSYEYLIICHLRFSVQLVRYFGRVSRVWTRPVVLLRNIVCRRNRRVVSCSWHESTREWMKNKNKNYVTKEKKVKWDQGTDKMFLEKVKKKNILLVLNIDNTLNGF